MGIKENLAKLIKDKKVKDVEDERKAHFRTEEKVIRVLERNGYLRPVVSEYSGERELYFKELSTFNRRVGFLMDEILNRKKTI